jgi:hypothetical protein
VGALLDILEEPARLKPAANMRYFVGVYAPYMSLFSYVFKTRGIITTINVYCPR